MHCAVLGEGNFGGGVYIRSAYIYVVGILPGYLLGEHLYHSTILCCAEEGKHLCVFGSYSL